MGRPRLVDAACWTSGLYVICFSAIVVVAGTNTNIVTNIFLPGTQPGQVSPAESFQNCATCHADIVRQWSGSTKAHAPRDPLFNALLSVTQKHTQPLGMDTPEYCLRCHAPTAWLAGRSHELSTQNFTGTDLDGVQCDFCHRLVNPVAPGSEAPVSGPAPGYGNGMYAVAQLGLPRRGPRSSLPTGHPVYQDAFFKSSELCGICHDVSNPYFSSSPATTAPHAQPALERTYSEWKNSWFATQGEAGSCQSCHMPRREAYTATPGGRLRLDVGSHDFSGVNTFIPRVLHDFWPGVDTAALQRGRERSVVMHRRAAALEVAAGREGASTVSLVRVTNLTGHKLPTGFAEGRRMWISVAGKNSDGVIVFQSGQYDAVTRTLLEDDQIKIYEAKLGPSSVTAASLNISAAPTFLPAFSDSTYFDNRIPPRGYSSGAFQQHRAQPVDYHYDDDAYWDVTRYMLPPEVVHVEASLWFQLASREFVEYLRNENTGNPYDWNNWGERVHSAWEEHGAPDLMGTTSATVQDGTPVLVPVKPFEIPVRIVLAQNFPNPFNSSTTIEFWLSTASSITLDVYDVNGRLVETLLSGSLEAGLHSTSLSSTTLASGIYMYRLVAGNSAFTKKLVVLR